MALIVGDEADCIAQNIRFHARQGVDHFAVMDNASRDGTREMLESLCADHPIEIVDQPDTDFRQDEWATALAERLRGRGLDWVIPNDADEFWSADSGSLPDALAGRRGVVSVRRHNVLPARSVLADPGFRFFHAELRVVRPLGTQRPVVSADAPLDVPIMLRTMPPKVACRLEGLRRIHSGGHTAEPTSRAPGPPRTSRSGTSPSGPTPGSCASSSTGGRASRRRGTQTPTSPGTSGAGSRSKRKGDSRRNTRASRLPTATSRP
jgi:hypothetical protein